MGLDGVELVLEFEDEFGIKIPDEDAVRLRTIGGVIRYIARRQGLDVEPFPIGDAISKSCNCLHAFHVIRRVLMQDFGVSRNNITTGQRITELVDDSRKADLQNGLTALGISPTFFRKPEPTVALQALMLLIAGAVGIIFIFHYNLQTPTFGAALVISVAAASVIALLVRRRLVKCSTTVGDVVRYLAEEFDRHFIDDRAAMECARELRSLEPAVAAGLQSIRERVYRIVAEQFGIKESALSDATHFSRDLGI